MKILLMILPLVCVAAGALAQDVEPQGTAKAEATQEQGKAQVAPGKEAQRQGADMRYCLKLKNNRKIIRCAEPGRKP